MLKPGVHFEDRSPITAVHASRMDVACFIGLVPMRLNVSLPKPIEKWLKDNRWYDRVTNHEKGDGVILEDIPVPIESWDMFTRLFEPGKRLDGSAELTSVALPQQITIEDDDQTLYVVVDGEEPEVVSLTSGTISLETLVSDINTQLQQAEVEQVPAYIEKRWYLVIRRKDKYTNGSINVFQNQSLGFQYSNVDKNGYLYTYLFSSFRAFFQQVFKKCYVILMGEPLQLGLNSDKKINKLANVLFGNDTSWSGIENLNDLNTVSIPSWVTDEEEQTNWHGLSILLGLSETTFLSLPDLADLLSVQELSPSEIAEESSSSGFVECVNESALVQSAQVSLWEAPRCSATGYEVWSRIVGHIADYLRKNRPETQLIASIPLPSEKIKKQWESFFQKTYFEAATDNLFQTLNSDQLQLTYPWLKTYQSGQLPSNAELPEGRLIGLLANSALRDGAYFSVAGTIMDDVYDLYPAVQNGLMELDSENRYLSERISFFFPTPLGISLQSDVTPANTKEKQYAVVKRLTMYIRRVVRQIGTTSVFEPNSANLWNHIERSLSQLMATIYQKQVLKGKTQKEAFSVICDNTTMTKTDIDNGRVITYIMFQPALPIEKIVVSLAFDQKGLALITEAES